MTFHSSPESVRFNQLAWLAAGVLTSGRCGSLVLFGLLPPGGAVALPIRAGSRDFSEVQPMGLWTFVNCFS